MMQNNIIRNFYKVIWLGEGYLNRSGPKIDHFYYHFGIWCFVFIFADFFVKPGSRPELGFQKIISVGVTTMKTGF